MSDFNLHGVDLFGDPIRPAAAGVVAERFIMPPFTVLDARQGDWQDRKRQWISLGIKSELGRGDRLTYTSAETAAFDHYREKKGKRSKPLANSYSLNGRPGTEYMPQFETGTSIFDPVLTELLVRWFSAPGSQIIDPYAGGSVRGIVAGALGRAYWGCELRQEQVAANYQQATEISTEARPVWHCGDSAANMHLAPAADMVLACPPYGDLERYSDDPADLSTMSWDDFRAAYSRIVAESVARMKDNGFAIYVIGNYRDDKGYMRDLCGLTVQAHENLGLRLYNEAVLVTAVGTAAFRVTKQFNAGRKLCKTHQNVLVFIKGDPKKTAAVVYAREEA